MTLLCRLLGHAQPRYWGQTSDLTAGGQNLRCYHCDADLGPEATEREKP